MSKHVRSALFYVLRRCGDICVKRGKKGGRGELKSLYGLPRRNGGGDSIDRNSFVLELEKRFSESRFFMETRPSHMGGGSACYPFLCLIGALALFDACEERHVPRVSAEKDWEGIMSDHPRTHQNAILRTYAGLLLISICVYTLMYAPQPMFNSVSRDFGVDKGSTGLLVSVFMLSLAVSPLCVGMLLSRIGVRRAILGASLLLGISGVGIWFAPSFLVLLGIRALQALLVPVVLTAVMSGIAVMFRHLDLNRALAGYVTSNLVGSLCGRIIGGWAAQMFGWRATLAVICFFFFLVLLFIRSIPEMRNASARLHSPREYLAVFKGRGVPSLFFAEACGIFVFAAIGNLIPFRMAELGQGHSEGLIGLMYFGYSVGLVASLSLAPLMRVFKTPTRLILFASAVYVVSCLTLAVPSLWALFGGLWLIAFGEFVVHSISPGLINHQAMLSGHGDRGMVNGLFLSCYYFGGLLGSYIPGALYSGFGWFACYLCIQLVQVAAFFVLFRLHRTAPDLR